MQNFVRTIKAAPLLLLASACGASMAPRESQPKTSESTLPEPREGVAEANDADGQAEHGARPKRAVEQQGANQQEVAANDLNAASDANEESQWSPESAQRMIERARHKLERRCEAGSQAACRAMPNLDKCGNLRRENCASLGDLFARGAAGVDRNPEHARDFWWRACDIASADCLRYGKLLFDIEGLESRQAVVDRFFQLACTSDFKLCESVGRFYQQKQELARARKFFDLGCAGGHAPACRAKE